MLIKALFVLALAAAGASLSEANKASSSCAKFLGSKPRTFLFVADPGTFSGTPENAVIVENLVGNTPFPKGVTSCPDARYGKIMGLPVAVVTTGIGPMASALCIYDIMEACGSTVKEIIYSGTSGWTPQLGGILNNGSCAAANSVGRINRVGDVCVSPFSVNWDCRKASWSMTAADYPNVCSFPDQLFGPSASFLFGTCEFPNVTATQLALSDEIIAAATRPGARSEMPAPSARIISNDAAYWTAMEAGTGVAYPPYNTSALPYVNGYTECAEIDSQYFWSGTSWDMVARKYVADVLSLGLGKTITQGQVSAVSAMEAIGISQGLERYYAKQAAGTKPIPFTSVRGMSNQAVQPVTPQSPGSEVWVPGTEVPEDFVNGYSYAIQSATSVVLSTLQARCLAAASASKKGGSTTSCTYTVTG